MSEYIDPRFAAPAPPIAFALDAQDEAVAFLARVEIRRIELERRQTPPGSASQSTGAPVVCTPGDSA